MTSTPSPTWYDVLGVRRDASPEEIKAAWRTATDKFEPGTGSSSQFRMFNEAADVLLDPERRAAYDESLPAEPQPVIQPVRHPVSQTAAAEPAPPPAAPELLDAPGPVPPPAPVGSQLRNQPRAASRLAIVLTAVLAVLTVAAVALAVVYGLKVRTESRVTDARAEAPAAAERAAKVILAYDYRHLPADRDRASAYLTAGFGKKYLANFKLLEKQKDGTPGAAVQTKTSVTSSVLGSGVVDAQEDRVRVLVFVNQVSTRPGRDPQIFQNRVAMSMQKHGNKWLVSDLKSY